MAGEFGEVETQKVQVYFQPDIEQQLQAIVIEPVQDRFDTDHLPMALALGGDYSDAEALRETDIAVQLKKIDDAVGLIKRIVSGNVIDTSGIFQGEDHTYATVLIPATNLAVAYRKLDDEEVNILSAAEARNGVEDPIDLDLAVYYVMAIGDPNLPE